MKPFIKTAFTIISMTALCLSILQMYVIVHEEGHSEACKHFGGHPIKTVNFLSGQVACLNLTEQQQTYWNNEVLIDGIGYQLIPHLLVLLLLFISNVAILNRIQEA